VAISLKADGTLTIEYTSGGKYAGLHVQAPETEIPDNATPAVSNFMLRNSELRSWPALTPFAAGGVGIAELGVSSFLDVNGAYHTVTWAGNTLYQYSASGPSWVAVGPAGPGNMQTNPLSYRTFANKIYYTDIGLIAAPRGGGAGGSGGTPPVITPFVAYWDGLTSAPVYQQTQYDASVTNSIAGIATASAPTVGGSLPNAPTLVGPIAIGAAFISELNNYLILGNVIIADQGSANALYNFPNLIWWSANGLPLQWDPTQNTSAGFNPFLDVSDQITGLAMLGIAGYIFRTYGITQMTPTGSAITPWQFDHMWASEHGIGNVHPFSIAQYGPTCAFIADDNIYSLSVTNAQPIGGTARDAIMTDLANSTGSPFANILPKYKQGYTYLTYNILIPLEYNAPANTMHLRMYVYSFEDQSWTIRDFTLPVAYPSPALTCAPNVV
jgi:hypothetical protein